MLRITLQCVTNASDMMHLSNKSKRKRIICDAFSIIRNAPWKIGTAGRRGC